MMKFSRKTVRVRKMKHGVDDEDLNDEVEALHAAARAGDVEVVESLLNRSQPSTSHKEISANVQNRLGERPLHAVCRGVDDESVSDTKGLIVNKLAVLQLLWEHGAKMNARGGLRKETALHLAVKSLQLEIVDFLISRGADANACDKDNRTPLHVLAAAKPSGKRSDSSSSAEAILNLLLQRGVNLHAHDTRWKTPLVEAVCSGNDDMVVLLLKAGAQINHQDRLGLTPLFYAVEMHSISMTTLLLSHHANVNAREQRRHSSPLHFVAGTGRYNIFADANDTAALARVLINAGAEVNAEDNEGSTTLHVAVDTKDERLVEALLDAGANVDKKDEYGNTPLHVLLMTAQIKTSLESIRLEGIARMLLDKGANVNEPNSSTETPFHYSLWRGHAPVVSDFLHHSADVSTPWQARRGTLRFLHETPACNTPEACGGDDVVHDEAFAPFNVAVALGHLDVVNLLLDYCGDEIVETRNDTGDHSVVKTALYLAVKNEKYEVARLLLEAGARVNRPVLHYTTALHVAVSRANASLAYLLLEYGADCEVKDVYGRIPLRCAVERELASLNDITKILVMHSAKREMENLSVSKEDTDIIESRKWLSVFRNNCMTELSMMKTDVLCDNFSMYGMMSKSVDSLTLCLENETIVNAFVSRKIEEKYPIYSKMMKIHFDLALERKSLLDDAIVALNVIFENIAEQLGYELFPDMIVRKILSYFTLRNLQKLRLLTK